MVGLDEEEGLVPAFRKVGELKPKEAVRVHGKPLPAAIALNRHGVLDRLAFPLESKKSDRGARSRGEDERDPEVSDHRLVGHVSRLDSRVPSPRADRPVEVPGIDESLSASGSESVDHGNIWGPRDTVDVAVMKEELELLVESVSASLEETEELRCGEESEVLDSIHEFNVSIIKR